MGRTIEIKVADSNISRIVLTGVESGLSELLPARRVIIITDSEVARLYRDIVGRYDYIVIGTGETTKTLATAEDIYRKLLALGADRDCFLLGFGGGIVTDITGFVAATFMRGVRFGFAASTLLSQIDAAIGGKNGVNLDGNKNIVGTFRQPEFVICDPELLKTLPIREFRAGLAEIIKAAIIGDLHLFEMLESANPAELNAEWQQLPDAIECAIKVKTTIVEFDEYESCERRKLNLGHTFAHAIEKLDPSFNHGEAVATGICMAAKAAEKLSLLSVADTHRIRNTIAATGLPTETAIDKNSLLDAIRHDKKVSGSDIHLILPTAIGACEVKKMPLEELKRLI